MNAPSSAEKALPPMPVPYEDFHYSLDLPADLDLNDLQFLGSVDRKAGPLTPGLTSHFHASTPQSLFGLDDIHMASRSNSRRGSVSKGSLPTSPHVSRFSESALRPPPPPDFEPSSSNLFGNDAFNGGVLSPFGVTTPGVLEKSTNPLFDAKEKNILVNFLEGFEWDFDPSLPDGLPSFATAATDRASSTVQAMGLQMSPSSIAGRGPMLHDKPLAIATPQHLHNHRHMQLNSSASGSASTSSTQSPHELMSSTATSPHGSYRGLAHQRSLSNKSRQYHQGEADLVNAAFGGGLSEWNSHPTMTGSKRDAAHFGAREADEQTQAALALGSLTGMHAEMFRMNAGLDAVQTSLGQTPSSSLGTATPGTGTTPRKQAGKKSLSTLGSAGKKFKTEHDDVEQEGSLNGGESSAAAAAAAAAASKRELLTESEKRQNHILSEQRRRNYIREGFKELVVLLDEGRTLGARALGLSSGFSTGVEDEGLDDRTDIEVDSVDVLTVGRKKPPKKAKKAGPNGVRQRGKGRGRGGSAGGGAGSKSAVLFQAVDLIRWLDGKTAQLDVQCQELERLADIPSPDTILHTARAAADNPPA